MTYTTIESERIDDVPMLIYWLEKMRVAEIIDAAIGKPHGNRAGLSYGKMAVVYIAYILSECNHYLSPVRDWVMARRECLSQALGEPIRETDFTDDRLEDLLDAIGDKQRNEEIEIEMGRDMIRAYELPTQTGRIDMTTVSVYHKPKGKSLLNYGKGKDAKPGLRQFKEVLATLDPAGIPLSSAMIEGRSADDPLYIPAWRQMVKIIGRADFLAVGDSKMASLETRAKIERGGGYYLTPLPMTGERPDELERLVLEPPIKPVDIYLPDAQEGEAAVGKGFEVKASRSWLDKKKNKDRQVSWEERVFVIRSDKFADSQQRGLERRLEQAEKALRKLKAKPQAELSSLNSEAEAIVHKYRVGEYLGVKWIRHTKKTKRYLKRGRHNENSRFKMVKTSSWEIRIQHRVEAIEKFNQLAGWRMYVSNAPQNRLDLAGAVACYREQWQPESGFRRLKGAVLAISPLLLRSDIRIRGLICILIIALRALTLFEFVVRRNLEKESESIAGLYSGNPNRKTTRPTTERMLKAFDGLTVYRLSDGNTTWYEMTPLSMLQQSILRLAGIPESIYAKSNNILYDNSTTQLYDKQAKLYAQSSIKLSNQLLPDY